MIIREKTLSFSDNLTIFYLDRQRDAVFFDIETTGLSWKYSRLYLIGAFFFREGQWRMRQWFLETPLEEPELLRSFSDFLKDFSTVVHFNGQGFDLPYLTHKYKDYKIPDPLPRLESLDLYRILRPWRKIFGLSSLKQKDVEKFLGISREDVYSGGELISCYEEYLRNASPELQKLLLLHNHDDLIGLTGILPLLGYRRLTEGDCILCSAQLEKGELTLSLSLNNPLPVPLSLDRTPFRLKTQLDSAVLAVDSFSGEMKHFFDAWKDYYYLPLEDCAVHKSVGVYVDKSCRQKAAARNCYQRTSGVFLPQPDRLFEPVFYSEYGASPSWFQLRGDFLKDKDSLMTYTRAILQNMLG